MIDIVICKFNPVLEMLHRCFNISSINRTIYISGLTGILIFIFCQTPVYSQESKPPSRIDEIRSVITTFSSQKDISVLNFSSFDDAAKNGVSNSMTKIIKIIPVAAADISRIPQGILSEYLQERQGYAKQFADSIVFIWQAENAKIADINFSLINPEGECTFNSISVFSAGGRLLFDELLSNLISNVSDARSVSTTDSKDTRFLEASARVTSLTGSVTLHWRVRFTAEISPYIDPVTNDGRFSLSTNEITCWKTDPSGIPPQGEPIIYLGQFGTANDINDPFESKITINSSSDHFYRGLYSADMSDGRGKSWSTLFNVSYDSGISVAPPDNPDIPVWLETDLINGQSIKISDKVYGNTGEKKYRGIFWNSGYLSLNNIITRAEEGGMETGSIATNIPINCAYTFWDASPIFQDVYYAGLIPLSVEYIRGHKIPDPVISLSADKYNQVSGENITMTVRVYNPSTAVSIEGGSVELDLSSLNNKITVTGNSSFPLESIPDGQYRDYFFTLQGIAAGKAIPCVTVKASWGYPAGDAGKDFSVSTCLGKNIEILPVPSITVNSPNGGESIQSGSNHNINWTSVNTSGYVDLFYSVDNGSTWLVISNNEPDDGSYSWTIPDLSFKTCLVRVSDTDGNPSDRSNSVFTISIEPVITVGSPNGGEIWLPGNTHYITWTSFGTSGNVRIIYSTDSGLTWSVISESTTDDGFYAWSVPELYSVNCLLKVYDVDNNPEDQSNSEFTISPIPEIVVLSPDGGESWQAGNSHDILWTSCGTSGNVQIFYSVNNGLSWTEIIHSTPDCGIYSWTIPDTPSSRCLVRVTDTDGSPADQSNSAFSVTAIPAITVTSPNRGETWRVGTNQNITWTSTGTSGNVRILYSIDSGSNWSEIIESTPDDGSYIWTIPDFQSTDCLVMISDSDGGPVDQSNVLFTITSVCEQVAIINQPSDKSICVSSGNTSFTVTATGSPPLTYQWQMNNAGEWTNVSNNNPSGAFYSNVTTSTLGVKGINSAGSYQYRCHITNCSYGAITSDVATLTVRTLPSVIVTGPVIQPDCNIKTGSVVLNGLPSTGIWTLTQLPDSTTLSGIGTSTTIGNLSPGNYAFTVTNSSGCTSEISQEIFIEEPDNGVVPKITIKYDDVLICYNLGDSLVSYQWYEGMIPIPEAYLQYYQTRKQPGIYSVQTIDINGCLNSSNSIIVPVSGSLKAYPNPASVSFAIKMDDYSEGSAIIRILNTKGIKVMEMKIDDFNDELINDISVTNLKEGIYFVQVLLNNKEIHYTKIVVAR
jgi:hypothetical protein